MDTPDKNHLHVACAIIEKNGRVLSAKRSGTMSMPNTWEFPGGKIRPGESREDCLKREIMEELAIVVSIRATLQPCTHDYPDVTVTLYPFICVIEDGTPECREHSALAWLDPPDLPSLDWAEADLPVVRDYLECMVTGSSKNTQGL